MTFRRAFAGALVIIVVALSLVGYGADNDTYLVLKTGELLRAELAYVPSRFTGYPVHEFLVAALAPLGYVATNAVSWVSAVAVVFAVRRLVPGGSSLSTITVGVLCFPAVVVASSSTIDYMLGLALFSWSWVFLIERRPVAAGVVAGLAVGTRPSYAILLAALAVAIIVTRRDVRTVLAAGAIGVAVATLLFVPAFLASGRSLAFLGAAPRVGDWSPVGWASRFVYKLYLFGGVGLGLAMAAVIRTRRPVSPIAWEGWTVIGVAVALFAYYPIAPSYLLPVVPPLVVLAMTVESRSRRWVLNAAAGLLVLHGLVLVDPLHIEDELAATGARVDPHLEPGRVADDLSVRRNHEPDDYCVARGDPPEFHPCPGG